MKNLKKVLFSLVLVIGMMFFCITPAYAKKGVVIGCIRLLPIHKIKYRAAIIINLLFFIIIYLKSITRIYF